MNEFSYVFTIFFVLLGPLKLIPAFEQITRDADERFQRVLAIWGTVIASIVVCLVALAAEYILGKYRISIDGLRIGGGLVLLLAAINTIFSKAQSQRAATNESKAIRLAASPLATPIIVPPAGVAAILTFMMLAPENPGRVHSVFVALAIIMALNFLAMYFVRAIVKLSTLILALQVLGQILIFMQVALAVETILIALRHMGIVPA